MGGRKRAGTVAKSAGAAQPVLAAGNAMMLTSARVYRRFLSPPPGPYPFLSRIAAARVRNEAPVDDVLQLTSAQLTYCHFVDQSP